LLGCGGPTFGEIESMHTASKHRGRGVTTTILTSIVGEARSRPYLLETGSVNSLPHHDRVLGGSRAMCP
jgi:hypothetical protein